MTATLIPPVYPQCPEHHLPAYPSRPVADAERITRRTRAALSGGQIPALEVRRCRRNGHPNTWHVYRAGAYNLADPHQCKALAKRLHQHGNDWRVDAAFVPGAMSKHTACEVCQREDRIGQVFIRWTPQRTLVDSSVDACAECAPEYLTSVVCVEAGDPDVHRDLIDVEVRRAVSAS